MSAVKGVNRTKMDTATPADRLSGGEFDGRVKCSIDRYEADGLVAASTIEIGGTIPNGAKILEIAIQADALGSGVTLAVGDSDTAARYISATAMNTGNKVIRIDTIGGRDYVIGTASGDNQLLITTAGNPATGTIEAQIFYTND